MHILHYVSCHQNELEYCLMIERFELEILPAFCEDGEVKVYVSDKAALMHLVACLLFSVSVTSTGWLFANMCLKLSLIFEICSLLYSLHYVSWTRMTIKNNELPAVTLANSYVTEAPRWAIIVYSDILSNE